MRWVLLKQVLPAQGQVSVYPQTVLFNRVSGCALYQRRCGPNGFVA